MVYSFARVGAALAMKVDDVFTQDRRLWVRLREKGGKHHEMPCHHNLETYRRSRRGRHTNFTPAVGNQPTASTGPTDTLEAAGW
jgi:integrase